MSDYLSQVYQAYNSPDMAASPPAPVAMPPGIDPSWMAPSGPAIKGSHEPVPVSMVGQKVPLSDRFGDMAPIGPVEPPPPPPPPTPTQGPPPAPVASPPPPQVNPSPGARSGGNEYPLIPVGGGRVIPAHEVEMRGPSLRAAQGNYNAVGADVIDRINSRNQETANDEYSMALDQERQARAREAAMQQSFAERDEEMAQRQADFDGTVKQLGKMGTIDRDRFWASRTTGQKIAGLIELAASGFNRTPSLVLKRIDDDVKAQEFAYYATKDTAQAKQTAFAQAMQKYQNADAARAMAKAAGIDVVNAQLAQMSAKWKGTEAANRADLMSKDMTAEQVAQIAHGIQFVQPQSMGRRFVDPRTGLVYSEAEAKAMSGKVDERDFENRKQVAGIGGQLAVEDVKAQNELQKAQLTAQKSQGERIVKLPNGELLQAPTDKEAEKLRDLSSAVWDAQQLVNEAIQIRSDSSWMLSPTKIGRLKQIKANLVTAFKDSKGLGALSGSDMGLAEAGTADPLSVMPGNDEKLRSFGESTNKALRNRVKGIADASDTARGELPPEAAADFKAYGGKK